MIKKFCMKEKLTLYQWWQASALMILNGVQIYFLLTYDKAMITSTCGHAQKMFYGTIFCLFQMVVILLAYKFQQFFGQLNNFVFNGTLPS